MPADATNQNGSRYFALASSNSLPSADRLVDRQLDLVWLLFVCLFVCFCFFRFRFRFRWPGTEFSLYEIGRPIKTFIIISSFGIKAALCSRGAYVRDVFELSL